jgi:hypothetical protein
LVSKQTALQQCGAFVLFKIVFIHSLKNIKMKNRKHYSKTELQMIQDMATKPVSTTKLAKRLSRELNRSAAGIYLKLLEVRKKTWKTTRVKEQNTKTYAIGKPTRIEFSEKGMTLYF